MCYAPFQIWMPQLFTYDGGLPMYANVCQCMPMYAGHAVGSYTMTARLEAAVAAEQQRSTYFSS